jgi:hypothetical protein
MARRARSVRPGTSTPTARALRHEDAVYLEARLHTHAEGTQQRAERRHEPAGAPATIGRPKPCSIPANNGVMNPPAPGMQQPWRVQVVDFMPAEIPAQVRPAAGDRCAQPPLGAAQPAAAGQTARVPHQREGAHLAAQQAAIAPFSRPAVAAWRDRRTGPRRANSAAVRSGSRWANVARPSSATLAVIQPSVFRYSSPCRRSSSPRAA